jgi:carbon starvation protein
MRPRSETRGTPVLHSPALALVTLIPLLWLLTVTATAAVQKIWHPNPGIGFLARAEQIRNELLPRSENVLEKAYAVAAGQPVDSSKVPAMNSALAATLSLRTQLFNNRLDATVTGAFLALVILIFLLSLREWILLLGRKKTADLREADPVWLPDYAVAEGGRLPAVSLIALTIALTKELSGEAAVDRVERHIAICADVPRRIDLRTTSAERARRTRVRAYLQASRARFDGVNRCC